MIKKYITHKDGIVTGVILIDNDKAPIHTLNLGEGVGYLEYDPLVHAGVDAGDLYDGSNFTLIDNPQPAFQPPTKEELLEQVQQLMVQIQALT